jgi:hypothetical protein
MCTFCVNAILAVTSMLICGKPFIIKYMKNGVTPTSESFGVSTDVKK